MLYKYCISNTVNIQVQTQRDSELLGKCWNIQDYISFHMKGWSMLYNIRAHSQAKLTWYMFGKLTCPVWIHWIIIYFKNHHRTIWNELVKGKRHIRTPHPQTSNFNSMSSNWNHIEDLITGRNPVNWPLTHQGHTRTQMSQLHKSVLSSACRAALLCAAMCTWNWVFSHLKHWMNIICLFVLIIILFRSNQPKLTEPESSFSQISVVNMYVCAHMEKNVTIFLC